MRNPAKKATNRSRVSLRDDDFAFRVDTVKSEPAQTTCRRNKRAALELVTQQWERRTFRQIHVRFRVAVA